MVIHPDSTVHVELTGWLSDFGRIECAAVTELILIDDTIEASGANCGSGEKLIGHNQTSDPSRLLVRNNPNLVLSTGGSAGSSWRKRVRNAPTSV